MKILFIILDGLGDRPIKALGGKTPLEAAKTPNLDFLASQGNSGLIIPVYQGNFPSSKDGHLSLFGYDLKKWVMARGVFEAVGAGMEVKKGDVCLRGNFATVDGKRMIVDRRAGRIEDTRQLIAVLQNITIKGMQFFLAPGIGHRIAIVIRGIGLSEKISDGDFHKVGIKAPKISPLLKTKEAQFTANVLNNFLLKAHQILKTHPLNKQRQTKGLLAANWILLREAGMLKKLPNFQKKWGFKAACIAGGKLYQAIGKMLGMDLIKVKGATAEANTNVEGKFEAAKMALKKYGFVYCHIKAADNFAHDGDFKGKKKFIEKVDKCLPILFGMRNILLVITADHATPCILKEHSSDPVPALVYSEREKAVKKAGPVRGNGSNGAGEEKFCERNCKSGALGKIKSVDFLKRIVKIK